MSCLSSLLPVFAGIPGVSILSHPIIAGIEKRRPGNDLFNAISEVATQIGNDGFKAISTCFGAINQSGPSETLESIVEITQDKDKFSPVKSIWDKLQRGYETVSNGMKYSVVRETFTHIFGFIGSATAFAMCTISAVPAIAGFAPLFLVHCGYVIRELYLCGEKSAYNRGNFNWSVNPLNYLTSVCTAIFKGINVNIAEAKKAEESSKTKELD